MRDKVSRPDREGVVDGGKERITIIDCGRRCSSRGLLRASGSPHALVLYLPHAHTAPGHLASPPPSPLLPLPLAPPPASTTTQRPCLSSRAYPVLSCHPPSPHPADCPIAGPNSAPSPSRPCPISAQTTSASASSPIAATPPAPPTYSKIPRRTPAPTTRCTSPSPDPPSTLSALTPDR